MVDSVRRAAAVIAAALMIGTSSVTAFADPGLPEGEDNSEISVNDSSSEIDDPAGTETPAANESSSEAESSSEEGIESIVPTVTLTAPKLTVRTSLDKIRISWKKVDQADKYYVYKQQPDGSFKKLGYTRNLHFTDKNLPAGVTQCYKITAVKGSKGKSTKVKVMPSPMRMLSLTADTVAYKSMGISAGIKLRAGYYTGYSDGANNNGYCVIYARTGKYLVKNNAVKGVGGTYKILSCGAMSQLDGSVCKDYACGPAAAAMIFNASTGSNVSVETAIKIAKKYRVTCYGDYTFLQDGMPCKGIKELIRAMISEYSVKNKKVTVFNTTNYSSTSSLTKALKKHLDQGHRMVVCVMDDSDYEGNRTVQGYSTNAPTHYVVLTGYTVSGGKTYFFTANSWYVDRSDYKYARNNNHQNRSSARYYFGLCCSSASELTKSMFAAANSDSLYARIIYMN